MKTSLTNILSAMAIVAWFGLATATLYADEVSPAVGHVPEPQASEKATGNPDDYYEKTDSAEVGNVPRVEATKTDDEEYKDEYEDHPAGPATQVQ